MALKRKANGSTAQGTSPALQKVIGDQEDAIVKALFFGAPGDQPPESQTLKEGDQFGNVPGGIIPPPINLDLWARMMEMNTRLGRSIRTFARNTMGLGWDVVPAQQFGPETPEDVLAEYRRQKEVVERLFRYPNPRMPFVTIGYLSKVDEEATGNGYIEVVRNAAAKISALYHISTVTVRLRKNGGYVQVRGSKKRFFREFGDENIVDPETGEILHTPKGRTEAGTKKYGTAKIPVSEQASEIIHFPIYSPRSSFYGLPRYMACAPAITGSRMAASRNVNFFENDATPRVLITVTGGRLAAESVEMLEKFIKRKGKGVENAHRMAVLQVEEKQVGVSNKPNRTQINVVPLTVGSSEDASFQTYRTANDEEIREAFGLSQVFFSAGNVNKSSAYATMEVTNNQEFEPDRVEKEYILNGCIVRDLVGSEVPLVKLQLRRPMLTDPMDQARIDSVYAGLGALTPNELRERIGKPRFPSNFVYGDKPLQIALTELSLGAAAAIRGISGPAVSTPAAGAAVPQGKIPAGAMPAEAVPQASPPGTAEAVKHLLDLAGDVREYAIKQMSESSKALDFQETAV